MQHEAHVFWTDSDRQLTRFMLMVDSSIADHISEPEHMQDGECFMVYDGQQEAFEAHAKEYGCTVEWS